MDKRENICSPLSLTAQRKWQKEMQAKSKSVFSRKNYHYGFDKILI
jgi:hypothetical protein